MRLLFTILALLISNHVFAQDFSKVEIKSTELSPSVYVLSGAGGNVAASIGEDGVFLVDDQYAPLTEKIQAAIKALSDKPVRFVINTHWHGDHVGGNENFGIAGAVIVAHDNVRKRMSSNQFMALFKSEVPAAPAAALPVVTFNDQVSLHLNGEEVRIIHVANAHTDGDALVHFSKSDVLHMGDILFYLGSYTFIDEGSGGSFKGIIAALEKGLALAGEKTKIIPGHGPVCNREQMSAHLAMMKTIGKRVSDLKAQGKTLQEVQTSKPTAEFDQRYGGGFIKPEVFVEFVYNGV